MLSVLVSTHHFVLHLIFHVLICNGMSVQVCTVLMLRSTPEISFLCSHNGFVTPSHVLSSLQCRALGQTCTICMFCIGMCIVGCTEVAANMLLPFSEDSYQKFVKCDYVDFVGKAVMIKCF